jgi:uncharacterized protein YbjQ (UPF0145 family)
MSTPARYSHDWPELWQIEEVMSRTTTAFELEGYRVVKTYGMVRGIMVRSRSVFGTFGAWIETLFGGNITLFTELCEKTRREAYEVMVAHAIQTGANAVIGVRYDATELMSGVSEVLCYGTAVVVEPTYGEEASGTPES